MKMAQCASLIAPYGLCAARVPEKSKRGIATPRQDIDLIRTRFAEAERHYRGRQN
jgi:hypothetical protein